MYASTFLVAGMLWTLFFICIILLYCSLCLCFIVIVVVLLIVHGMYLKLFLV